MRKIFIRMSFLADNYYGSQKLNNHPTIQGAFEDALSNVFNEKIKVTICSRLDRFVNAFDFAISFSTINTNLSLDRLKFYLSNYLKDIHIKDVKEVDNSFSSRYSCKGKIYSYLIQNGSYNPLFKNTSLYLKNKIDEDKLKEGLSFFEGEHEFKNFASFDEEEESKLLINKTLLTKENGLTILSFSSRNFLKYQIRFMVGTILQYGYNKILKEDIKKLLAGENIKFQRKKVEPNGLFLYKIIYPEFDDDNLEFDEIKIFK